MLLHHLNSLSVVISISMLIQTLLPLTNSLTSLTISISPSTSTFQLMMTVTSFTFSPHDPALLLSHTFHNRNLTCLITNLSHSNFSHTSALQLNEQPYNIAPTKPSILTISKVTSSLPLSTQTQHPIHPTLQINFPPPANPFSTSMPQSNQKLLSKDLTHHGLIPKFSKPSVNVIDLSDVGVAQSLLLTARNFKLNANSVRSLISKAKSSFLSNIVTESSDNPRSLWKTLNTILHRDHFQSPWLLHLLISSKTKLNASAPNFYHLILLIRFSSYFPPAPSPKLFNFISATLTEIHKLISSSEDKQCTLYSIPTFFLKVCFNELGPIITNLVNLSLSEGIFPPSFKQALVQPLLKKPSLSTDDLNNFRPIFNLKFISKILEKVIASRIQSYLSSDSLSSSFQSAYRVFHSSETTLLKIHNDLIFAMDRGEVTLLILLDLSAAFDTVDHSILLARLQNWFGLGGLFLDWFTSYLSSRSLRQSQSMIPSLHSLLSPVVYPKVPYLAHLFLLSILLLLAR